MNCNSNQASQIRDEENKRIYERLWPSAKLQPYLDVRPVMTKYSLYPVVDPRSPIGVGLEDLPTYNVNQTFNPGTRQAPWSGFASNINTESILRNQVYALQKCSQAVYVPGSQSDLYENEVTQRQRKMNQNVEKKNDHSLLFKQEKFEQCDPNYNSVDIGNYMFNNCTRCQLKDLTDQNHCN